MGVSISWIAVKDVAPEKIFEHIGLKKTTNKSDWTKFEYSYIDMKNGWHLIIAYRVDVITERESWVLKLSELAQTIAVFVEEHVMYSAACCFENGKRVWFIEHDCERGLEDVKTDGTLPTCFEKVHKDLLSQLKSDPDPCDYLFDVPVEVSRAFTGYRYDQWHLNPEDEVYWELVKA